MMVTVTVPGDAISARLVALNEMDPTQLREEWKRLFRAQPPRLSRDLLIRGLAWRIQELAFGGLSRAVERRLAALGKSQRAGEPVSPEPTPRIRAGTRLVREWHGRTHSVTVTEDGFSYEGRSYRSLTQIAREITGAGWSGPRFFGLRQKTERGPRRETVAQTTLSAKAGEGAHGSPLS